MRTYLDCIPCFLRQALDAVRMATDDAVLQEHVVREVALLAGRLDRTQSPPQMGQKIHRLIRDLTGNEDPYRCVKIHFNEEALRLYPELRQTIVQSEQPLETAIRLAIAGNIIDFGVNGAVHKNDLDRTIRECLAADFSAVPLLLFEQAVREAESILFLADNAGEIVFDRLLIEQLPTEKITVTVKGSPIINDATVEDAEMVGLSQIVEVIDNGADVPGTILDLCSPSFREHFERADLVIAKGQGNYETLSEVDKNIFFILKAKCPVIARDLDCPVGQMIFQRTNAFEGEKENARI